MRVDSDSYRRFRRWALVRAILYLAAGALVAVFSVFWLVIGIVAFFVSDPYPILNGLLFTVLGGLVPGVGAALLLHRAATWLLDPRAPRVEPPESIRAMRGEYRGQII